jgi:hypothetical protein
MVISNQHGGWHMREKASVRAYVNATGIAKASVKVINVKTVGGVF